MSEIFQNKHFNATHGMSKTRIYHEWTSMRGRCKPNSQDAKTYYNRGITVCDEWQNDFVSFYFWAIENGYNDSLSIDRIDNNKGYFPNNCRWIPIEQQQSNKSNNIIIEYNGEKYCLRALCQKLDFPYKRAHRRYMDLLKKNKPIDLSIIFAPIKSKYTPYAFRK